MRLHDDVEEVTSVVKQVVMWHSQNYENFQRVESNVEKVKFDQKGHI